MGHNRTSTSEGPWVSQHWRTLHVCSNDEWPVVGGSQISDGGIEFKQTEMTDDELLDRSLLGNAPDDCRCCVQGNIRTGRDCKMHVRRFAPFANSTKPGSVPFWSELNTIDTFPVCTR